MKNRPNTMLNRRMGVILITLALWTTCRALVASEKYQGEFSHRDLGTMSVELDLESSIDSDETIQGAIEFLSLKRNGKAVDIGLKQNVKLSQVPGQYLLTFGKLSSPSATTKAEPYPEQTEIVLIQQEGSLKGVLGHMTITIQLGTPAAEPEMTDDGYLIANVDHSQSLAFYAKRCEILSFALAGENELMPAFNKELAANRPSNAAKYAAAYSKLQAECLQRLQDLDPSRNHYRLNLLYEDDLYQAKYLAESWQAVADGLNRRVSQSEFDQIMARANGLVTSKATGKNGGYAFLLQTLMESGTDLGVEPEESGQPDPKLVKDQKSLSFLQTYANIAFGEDNEYSKQFARLWQQGQDLLSSRNIQDVQPSADLLQQAQDLRAEVIQKIDEHPWNNEGVHPYVVGTVIAASDLLRKRHEITERLIAARYRFAETGRQADMDRHNQISQELGATEREDLAFAGTVGTMIDMFQHGMILPPMDRMKEAIMNSKYQVAETAQSKEPFNIDDYLDEPVQFGGRGGRGSGRRSTANRKSEPKAEVQDRESYISFRNSDIKPISVSDYANFLWEPIYGQVRFPKNRTTSISITLRPTADGRLAGSAAFGSYADSKSGNRSKEPGCLYEVAASYDIYKRKLSVRLLDVIESKGNTEFMMLTKGHVIYFDRRGASTWNCRMNLPFVYGEEMPGRIGGLKAPQVSPMRYLQPSDLTEADRFEGTWIVSSALRDGQQVDEQTGTTYEFSAGRLKVTNPRSEKPGYARYAVRPDLSFGGLDVLLSEQNDLFWSRMIYKFENNILQIGFLPIGSPRPNQWEGIPGLTVVQLQKISPINTPQSSNVSETIKLAKKYYRGNGLKQDYDKAKVLFDQAAKTGDVAANLWIARNMVLGRCGFDKDLERAEMIGGEFSDRLDSFFASHHEDATYLASECYLYGLGVEQDEEKAKELLEQAANDGHLFGMAYLGYEELDARDYDSAWYWFARTAPFDTIVLNAISEFYESGKDFINESPGAAMACNISAAHGGETEAINRLGFFIERGLELPPHKAGANIWYEYAAEQGEIMAIFNLGVLAGEAEDYSTALQWHQKAADLGYDPAICELALYYARGFGVKQDLAKAKQILKEPLAADLRRAHEVMGIIREIENPRSFVPFSAEEQHSRMMQELQLNQRNYQMQMSQPRFR